MDHIKTDHSNNTHTGIIVIASYQQPLHFRNFLPNPFQTPSKSIFPGTSSNVLFKSIPAAQKNIKVFYLGQAKYTLTNNLSGTMVSRHKVKTKPQQCSWTVTADRIQLMGSSRQGSVSLGEMPEAQQARCVSSSNSRKALCKCSAWEGCLCMAHVTGYS